MAPLPPYQPETPEKKPAKTYELGEESAKKEKFYSPTEKEKKVIAYIENKFTDLRRDKQNHEPQWYINAAFLRGNQNVSWSATENRLINPPLINPNRNRRQINRIFAKVRARRAKFLKNRPTWVVVPATTDLKDKLDAKATGKVLDYVWRKLHLEAKYRDAVEWAETCARGFWWFSWDPDALGRISTKDPMTGQTTIQEGVVGEVVVECGSPFEIFVGNPGSSSLAYQDEIIRAKERTLDYVRGRFPEKADFVTPESTREIFHYENQIATLNTNVGLFSGTASFGGSNKQDIEGNPTTVIVKEYFRRPSHDYPKGKYCVVAGGVLLKEEDELPFGFWDLDNPFPCVEFVDVTTSGQYWGTTVLEQLIEPQREYNGVRTMISTQIKLMGHPKVFVAQQHQIPDGAWTTDAGEIITFVARPGIKEPYVWQPPNIVSDAWNVLELIKTEFDDLTQIYPATEGKGGAEQSGYQTNLLQEAANDVHAPDIRAHELSIEEAAFKIRRIIKRGYDVPRLVTVTSASYEPEVFEFSADDVDEYADIVVQAGSALPMLKGAKIQVALDLYAKGLLGDPMDPQVKRRVLGAIDMGSMGELTDYSRIDEDMIEIENSTAEDGEPLAEPRFFENHQRHWEGHINKLKSPAIMNWPPPARMGLLAHAIQHAKYINHAAAYQMAVEAGMPELIPPPPPLPMMPPGVVPPGGAPPGGPAGGPQPSQGFNEVQSQIGTNVPTAQGANSAS